MAAADATEDIPPMREPEEPVTLERIAALRDELDAKLREALPAAQRVVDVLADERPPATSDLATLALVRSSFDSAFAALADAGIVIEHHNASAVRAAADQLRDSEGDEHARELLWLVSGLTAPQDNMTLTTQLGAAHDLAKSLLAQRLWGKGAREDAAVLGLLPVLSDPSTDAAARMAAVQQIAATHPDLVLLAVSAEQLVRPSKQAATDNLTSFEVAAAVVQTASVVPKSETTTPPTPGMPPLAMPPAVHETRTTAPATPAVSEAALVHSHVVRSIAKLIGEQRYGMAAAIAAAADWPDSQQATLRIAGLAAAVRSETGACTAALRGELDAFDTSSVVNDTASALIAVPALLRAALVTGEPTAGALLCDLAPHVEPNLGEIANQVGRRALQGTLVGDPPLTVLADVSEIERSLHAVSAAAGQMLRPRTLRFKRASDIAKVWLAPNGLLGRPLSLAANQERNAVNEVASAILRLGDSSHINRELDALDRRFKGNSGKPLQGSGRQDLLNLVAEALKPLADWTEAVLALNRSRSSSQQWSTGEIAEMRTTVLAHHEAVLAALEGQASHSEPLTAAAGRAAIASLTMTFAVLEGQSALPTGESTSAFTLTVELLKVAGAAVDAALGRIAAPVDTTVETLLAAAEHGWDDAVDGQVEAENFAAAHFLLHAADEHLLPGDEDSAEQWARRAAQVEVAEANSRAALDELHEQLSAKLRRARLNNELSDEQDGELTSLLKDARTDTPDLADTRAKLRRVSELLPRYQTESARRLSERLTNLAKADAGTVERITRLIDSGQLSTAEELIYFLEIDVPVPQVTARADLGQFFPAVPRVLPSGLTASVLDAVHSRSQVDGCAMLNFAQLSPDLARLAAEALAGWRKIAGTPPEGRLNNITERDLLLPALRVAGIDGKRIRRLDELPRGRDRRFIDVYDVNISGKALVPAFGTKLGGQLRVLLAWGQPSAELLMSYADQDPSGESLLIAYFGTMSPQTRQELAARAVRSSAPVVVLDDAALAYLAAHGNRQMDAAMSVLLPFSSVNPYLREKRGLVAEEMFYGRDAERKGVLDPDGTQIVFGGRGLGKSALLRSAGAVFEGQGVPGERLSIYLSLDTVGIRTGSAIGPDAIWNALLRDLTDREIIARTRTTNRGNPQERVRAGVLAWLNADPRRRLLVLLDECDRFFESDAPEFLETTRLKDLGLSTDGRVKVVFAGLHSVQRYAKSARNGPFSHLAQRPTIIGPLRPQFAANLLTRPLHALGFTFANEDLVNRVLGYCSYQPFLLQMFGNRLVETMHAKRAVGVSNHEPPYIVTRSDIETVETNTDLRADISAAFHDTLHLDPRYNVIANVLAHNAHESGLDARLSDVQLREECLDWWHAGFATLDVEGFRSYLVEMVGLGVLAPNNDGRGWHLRSPNVLRMIGSKDDVVTQLVGAAILSVPDEFIALETRLALKSGRRSPLTASQTDDVLGDHANQVRVVLGSSATGIEDVAQAVRLAADVGDRFTVPTISSRRQFEEELITGRPGERRVVLTDLMALQPREEACTATLAAALDRRPTRSGVTRSAVIVAGPQQLRLWQTVLADAGTTPALGTVALRRYDRRSLRVWALASEKFSLEERLERLLEVTGGWPMLVEQAASLVASGMEEGDALIHVASGLAAPAGAADLIDAVGLTADDNIERAFAAVLSLVDSDGVGLEDLQAAASMATDTPETAVACLAALQVFNIDADGLYRPEPLLVRCWPHRA
ncbi:hypothetical protein [Streptacidiphilus sp. MAP5-3]|uniref:hypothetical protein n=1 Tax=unclassified Streptacidiphilus TaxID=2643834 RepID=UPI00351520B4